MTYTEVQEFLFSQLPMYQRVGQSAFKKDLKNIIALCNLLGNPQEKIKTVHIAGTNGKGSVSHIIAAGLQANGYKVGVYTSPHYRDYRERIKINGTLISEDAVITFVKKHKADFAKIQPSFFEITVALAFDYFANQMVDIAIIETGLGGRLDSTNIITPILSVITNISMDHQSMLGDTIEQIAGEKAGIIKQNIPVIIGEYQEDVFSVFEDKSTEMQSSMTVASTSTEMEMLGTINDMIRFRFHVNGVEWINHARTPLSTAYQKKNLITGLYTLHALQEHFELDPIKIAEGLEDVYKLTHYIGRWMKVKKKPQIILDSAHNVAGIQQMVAQIDTLTYDKLHIVWGMASDKDVKDIFSILPKEATYYFVKADIPRGMTTEILAEKAAEFGLLGLEYATVQSGYRNAIGSSNKSDLIIVAGSIFVLAEII